MPGPCATSAKIRICSISSASRLIKAPVHFGESTMVAFRKRFSEEDLTAINEMIIAEKGNQMMIPMMSRKVRRPSQADGPEEGEGYSHEGTLILDATCAPADIRYPQDLKAC